LKLSKQTALFEWKLTNFQNDNIETNENNHFCLFNDCRETMECSAVSYYPDFSTELQVDHGRIVKQLAFIWTMIQSIMVHIMWTAM